MNVAAVRDSLERTGVLFTQHEGDVGHLPDFWRSTILDLCEALDAAPMDAADLLRQERAAHAVTKDELAKAIAKVAAANANVASSEADRVKAEDGRLVALRLVADAVPRMRTLNNAMSPAWLARAAELLED